MQVEQANFKTGDNVFVLSVLVPDIKSIRAFAQTLHARGEAWSGIFEGWSATYTPEDRTHRPSNSRMTFVPAEFFVGKSAIWHVAIAWEDGGDAPPVQFENRRGISGMSHIIYLDDFRVDANTVTAAS